MSDQEHLERCARAWVDAGFSVVHTHPDGGKRPAGEWAQYQASRQEWESLSVALRSSPRPGIGVVTGAVSGNVEMLEIEGPEHACRERLEQVRVLAAEVGCSEVLDRVLGGLCEHSAGGGQHMFMQVVDGVCMPNTKLASQGQGSERRCVAETRGEGGFVVVAPTTARNGHTPGASYRLLPQADPARVAEVTVAERDLLYAVVTAALDEPDADDLDVGPMTSFVGLHSSATSTPPGRDWAARTGWHEILPPHGWTPAHVDRQGRQHWSRPGKSVYEGTSATTIEDGPMYVFSTSTSLPAGKGMSKFYVFAHYHHLGDMSAAARDLRAHGFGDQWIDGQAGWAMPGGVEPVGSGKELDYDHLVQQRYVQMRATEDAKALMAADRAGRAPVLAGTTLSDFLAEPDVEENFRIQGLWTAQSRVLLAAAAKAGKTTLVVGNLLPALVDGEPFLGSFAAAPVSGRVAYFNMEVGENVIRQWMRDAAIDNTDRVIVANLRGRAGALALDSEAGRRRLGEWLLDNGIDVVVLDPLAPLLASLGIDENSNTDVARFFAYWNEAMTLGGVQEDLIVHHTGHGGTRSRGASRLLDEPDAIWTLTKSAEPDDEEAEGEFIPIAATRSIHAYGRDVELPPTALAFEASNRRLIATGPAPRKARNKVVTLETQRRKVMTFIAEHPGANTRRVSEGAGIQKSAVPGLLRDLVAEGALEVIELGTERLYSIRPRPVEDDRPPSPVPGTGAWGTGDAPDDAGETPADLFTDPNDAEDN